TPAPAPASAAAGGLLPQRRGPSWDGAGEMPDWLRRAGQAGQSAEFYRV
ncbi:histone-like nucleoid-structuring protein, partial [Cupriavidus sp. SK-4]